MTNEKTAITVYDRETAIFEVVTVAILAIKNNGNDLQVARAKLGRILQQHHLHVSREQLAILLKHEADLEESVKISLERERKSVVKRYRLY